MWDRQSPAKGYLSKQKNELNFRLAEQRKSGLEAEERKWNLFGLLKWDVIKERKAEMMVVLNNLRECSRRQHLFKLYFVVVKALKLVNTRFKDIKAENKKIMDRLFSVAMVKRKLLKFLLRFGPDSTIRNRIKVNHCLTTTGLFLVGKME